MNVIYFCVSQNYPENTVQLVAIRQPLLPTVSGQASMNRYTRISEIFESDSKRGNKRSPDP